MTLPELAALCEKATPGPWECDDEAGRATISTEDGFLVAYPAEHANIKTSIARGRIDSLDDARFIAAADPTTVLKLVRVAMAAEAVRSELAVKPRPTDAEVQLALAVDALKDRQ